MPGENAVHVDILRNGVPFSRFSDSSAIEFMASTDGMGEVSGGERDFKGSVISFSVSCRLSLSGMGSVGGFDFSDSYPWREAGYDAERGVWVFPVDSLRTPHSVVVRGVSDASADGDYSIRHSNAARPAEGFDRVFSNGAFEIRRVVSESGPLDSWGIFSGDVMIASAPGCDARSMPLEMSGEGGRYLICMKTAPPSDDAIHMVARITERTYDAETHLLKGERELFSDDIEIPLRLNGDLFFRQDSPESNDYRISGAVAYGTRTKKTLDVATVNGPGAISFKAARAGEAETSGKSFVFDGKGEPANAKFIQFTVSPGSPGSSVSVPDVTKYVSAYDFSAFPFTDLAIRATKYGGVFKINLDQAEPSSVSWSDPGHLTSGFLGGKPGESYPKSGSTWGDSSHRFVRTRRDPAEAQIPETSRKRNGYLEVMASRDDPKWESFEDGVVFHADSPAYASRPEEKAKLSPMRDSYRRIASCPNPVETGRNFFTSDGQKPNGKNLVGWIDMKGGMVDGTEFTIHVSGERHDPGERYARANSVSGEYVKRFIDDPSAKDMAVCYSGFSSDATVGGNAALPGREMPPTLDFLRFVYYENELEIIKRKATSYTRGSSFPVDFKFTVAYDGKAMTESAMADMDFVEFWVSESQEEIGLDYGKGTGETVEYPAILTEKGSDTRPPQKPASYDREDGVYHALMPYGAIPRLNPYGYVVTGLTGEGMQCNGSYLYVSGNGWTRLFRHSSKEMYIRRYNDESRWCVTSRKEGRLDYGSVYVRSGYDESYGDDIPESFTDSVGYGQANLAYFPGENENGKSKPLYIKMFDRYGNAAATAVTEAEIYSLKPYDETVSLTGSSGNRNYTGFRVSHGRYVPTDYVKVSFSARSKIDMEYMISGDVEVEDRWHPFTGKAERVVKLKPVNSNERLLGNDTPCTVRAKFRDEAGNESHADATIRYISVLHRTENQNLLEDTAGYSPSLFAVRGSMVEKLTKKRISVTEFTRSWNEIYYPEEHGVPLNRDGSVNEEEARRISNPVIDESGKNGPTSNELSMYDRLALTDKGMLETDSEGRFVQNVAAWSVSKTYPENLNKMGVSSTEGDFKYWIIDNSGNSDFKLEFEVFDLDGKITRIPANYSAGSHEGDTVVVYDADAEGCLERGTDENGKGFYRLADSSKLRELFALKGSYLPSRNNPFRIEGEGVTESLVPADSGFVTPSITSATKICVMMYSDSNSNASGFKLKAGPRHPLEHLNYDENARMGEFWVHQSPEQTNGQWRGCEELRINYKYYGSFSETDRERSSVSFSRRLDFPLMGSFTHYLHLGTDGSCGWPYGYFTGEDEKAADVERQKCIRDFMLYNDDLVDYSEPSFYVAPRGVVPVKDRYYDFDDYLAADEGKMSGGYKLNKDVGMLTFPKTVLVPRGRIFSDYFHHTYYRLTNDGYGDLHFYGTGILVPASATESYSDWAYVDLKIVNEGTNQLNSGTLKFLARGYISSGTVVDTVLDNNRPWDVQQGTLAETVQRCGAFFSPSYSSLPKASRKNAYKARESQTVTFGTLNSKSAVYVRVFWCIANDENGTSWIECTRGRKAFSSELAGKYYVFTTGA